MMICSIANLIGAQDTDPDGMPCDSPIFCYGSLLHTVQTLKLFPDSKWFVDLPLKVPPAVALAEFAKLGPIEGISADQMRIFLNSTFLSSPENNMVVRKPIDYKSVSDGGLSLHQHIAEAKYQVMAEAIHEKWESLGRTIIDDVRDNPDQHSLIYLPNPFIIPGGRFREIYYWDSFWVIQGLLVSGMTETARGMILNFVHLIDLIGHIPNGNRVYYEKRSQPPFLAMMVDAYIKHPSMPAEDSRRLILECLPALVKEHNFWMTERAAVVTRDGKDYVLNLYKGGITEPRPESYREDFETAANVTDNKQREQLYADLGAGAESGWDFSSRWMDTATSPFNSIRTETIVPVDLNAILCAQERLIGEFYQTTGNSAESDRFANLARQRADAIQAVFWNEEKAMWRDFDLKRSGQREEFYLSHIAPLFARCRGSTVDIMSTSFMNKLLNSPDIVQVTSYPGGFPASLTAAGPHTQWDLPNAWPPSQLMLIEGFAGNPEFRKTALSWAQKWVTAVYTGFEAKNLFYEKYDVNKVGVYGGGGEYVVQDGFGWTNGGILRLLQLFPTELQQSEGERPSAGKTASGSSGLRSAPLLELKNGAFQIQASSLALIFAACAAFVFSLE
ncbi:Trehalase [Hypsibius exemplaris]|uniref:Trehalase n=1 Tax=Hypsibius exemplaris TaxID=2072580 RepID=A0A1W0WAB8_HYPEX|nr:Trehalase [Hypsibius exemplaris]